jgi:hypothetical protein
MLAPIHYNHGKKQAMTTTGRLALAGIIGLFFLLGLIFVAVVMNHFAHSREIRVIQRGRYRKLSTAEQKRQNCRGMMYRIEESIQISVVYDGRRDVVTIPIGRVFDGDSLKKVCGYRSTGIAWVVHDWLYTSPHAMDSGVILYDRKHADEIMYELLSYEGVVPMVYASILRLFDSTISTTMDRAWDTVTDSNVYVPLPESGRPDHAEF